VITQLQAQVHLHLLIQFGSIDRVTSPHGFQQNLEEEFELIEQEVQDPCVHIFNFGSNITPMLFTRLTINGIQS